MTVSVSFEEFILSRRLAGCSSKTLVCYRDFVIPFVAKFPDREITLITRCEINDYLCVLMDKPVSMTTKATYIRHFKVFLKWCEKEYGCCWNSVSIAVPRTYKKIVYIYSDEQIATILNTVTSTEEHILLRNKSIIALMLDSGLRQGEVCSLRRLDFCYDSKRLKVLGKGSKERIVPLGSLSRMFVQKYLKSCPFQSDKLFVDRFGSDLTCNAVKNFVYKLSVALPFEFSSHKLRHNFATNYCLDQYNKYGQVDIYRLMILLGHSEVETTRRYLHLANSIIAANMNISHLDAVYGVT